MKVVVEVPTRVSRRVPVGRWLFSRRHLIQRDRPPFVQRSPGLGPRRIHYRGSLIRPGPIHSRMVKAMHSYLSTICPIVTIRVATARTAIHQCHRHQPLPHPVSPEWLGETIAPSVDAFKCTAELVWFVSQAEIPKHWAS